MLSGRPFRLRGAAPVLLWAALLVGAGVIYAPPPVAGSSYTVPAISELVAVIPSGPFGSDIHALCLVRSDEPSGGEVSSRVLCYSTVKPTAPPTVTLPPFEPPFHQRVTATFNQGTGQLTVTLFECEEVLPGFLATGVSMNIQLDKAGGPASGTAERITDVTAPFDCQGETPATGPLTLTPLAFDHDEDGDGCTDWVELGPDPPKGLNDPFNPNDCAGPPGSSGSLSGVSDVLVHLDDKNLQAYYCKTRTDHDATTNVVKTASTCYSDTQGQEAPGNKVPINPDIDLLGPPPPPPYGEAGPQKGFGSYDPVADTLVTTSCFASVGGTVGPNVIWEVTVLNAKADLPNQSGIVDIFFGQGIDDCEALVPAGSPTQTLPLNIDTYDSPPYAKATSVDSDSDACADAFELDKNRPNQDCGDDPWNPHDSDDNFTGTYSITVELIRADTCPLGGNPLVAPPLGCLGASSGDTVAGSYFNCQAYLDHEVDNEITGKAFCYNDNPITTVNSESAGSAACNPIGGPDCGDGLPGAPPPGPFGDNDGAGTPGVIIGALNKGSGRLELDLCFSGIENPTEGPSLYMRLDVDAHTMLGTADIWLQQSDCVKPTRIPDNFTLSLALGEQNDANCSFNLFRPDCYDVDQDGCSARQELGTDIFAGGQRDPYNKYDHMDMDKDGTINIPDINAVAALFGPSTKGVQGNVGPSMIGSVSWAHRNGDSAINIGDDILGMAAQFGHNCQ